MSDSTLLLKDAKSAITLQGISMSVAMVAHLRLLSGTKQYRNDVVLANATVTGVCASQGLWWLFDMQSALSREVKY